MDQQKLKHFIRRYEEVYLFAMKRVNSIISEKVLEELTIEQYQVLRYITGREKCRSTELAEVCGVNKSAITAMIDRLVLKGFVERTRDEEDRRGVFLTSSPKGKEVFEKGEQQIQQFVASYLTVLTEEEIDTFLSVYEKIYKMTQGKYEEEEAP
ncbi:MarR family transcriptional regulator [Metabacillus sp. GX 13764]|uniref:MarR family winged helix-turn-helix transcriptional regulator n=1 Tax=Metabacillus kandeliae TaxID=2900151 RepID=UPI001E3BFF11|nr:MarR family transcriptional regulator [Metabacillus kandeliae]MCD7033714.1 MarR family transcriptional regulator [Metabacillus kandeliae]